MKGRFLGIETELHREVKFENSFMLSRFLEHQHNTRVFQKRSSLSARPYSSTTIVLSKNIQTPFSQAPSMIAPGRR